MSQPALASKLSRPRRGTSRAPSRLGASALDQENPAAAGATITTTLAGSTIASNGGPRLHSKASSSSLGPSKRSSATGLPTATLGGKATNVLANAAARKALNDVSNARPAAGDRNSKDGVIIKPTTRARTASQGPAPSSSVLHPPSSTGTGISRLKIVGAVAPKARRAAPSGRAPPAADDNAWHGAWEHDDDLAVETLQKDDGPNVGLGFETADGRDAVAEVMYEQPPTSSPSRHGVKRNHLDGPEQDGDLDDEEDELAHHDDKVRVLVDEDTEDWMVGIEEDKESEALLEEIKREFNEELDFWDTTMVAEYAGEIFEYMGELEEAAMPNPRYMDFQTEIEWSMRTTLIDWLLQVHLRYHLVPETLWIAVNIIDRFLSNRIVSLVKFQLVGVTAMFVAAKYEEIMAPSVDEFVYMTEGGYTREEILKGERIILGSLEFNISSYCSPYTWVRRISKADDYDIQTRTLSKFLMEVTLLDHRFLRAKPSMIAAIGMYLARRMLGGEWNDSFIYYSNYTEAQLIVPTCFLVEQIAAPEFDQRVVYKKYSNKKFLKASLFARNWAVTNARNWVVANATPPDAVSVEA